MLTAAPFATVQMLDGQSLGGSPEQTAIPAAADSILCQLDEQVSQILREIRITRDAANPPGRNVFSSFGVQALTHPIRLLVDAGVQRAVLGIIECLLPLQQRSCHRPPHFSGSPARADRG